MEPRKFQNAEKGPCKELSSKVWLKLAQGFRKLKGYTVNRTVNGGHISGLAILLYKWLLTLRENVPFCQNI